jgi:hypothetical protein
VLRNVTHEVALLDRVPVTDFRGRVVYQEAAGPLVGCRFTVADADPRGQAPAPARGLQEQDARLLVDHGALAHADGSPLRASDVVRLASPPGGDWTVTGVRWSPVALRVDLTRVTP